MSTQKQIYRYDFTFSKKLCDDPKTIINKLKIYCKKYVFQLEQGSSTGFLHWQGRISLKDKMRLQTVVNKEILKDARWSPTSSNCKGFDYVMKGETRIGKTYRDDIMELYIPRQYRNKLRNLRPFQQTIFDRRNDFDDRIINYIYCCDGNIGKSVIASICELFGNGIDLPVINDGEKVLASACNICMAKQIRNPTPIFIDIPRAFNQERMGGIFTAIEQIKKGKLYDMRYNYKTWWIDSPQMWVFANVEPDFEYLSLDRWKVWKVNSRYELVPYSTVPLVGRAESTIPEGIFRHFVETM